MSSQPRRPPPPPPRADEQSELIALQMHRITELENELKQMTNERNTLAYLFELTRSEVKDDYGREEKHQSGNVYGGADGVPFHGLTCGHTHVCDWTCPINCKFRVNESTCHDCLARLEREVLH